jgi:hypothetical protein
LSGERIGLSSDRLHGGFAAREFFSARTTASRLIPFRIDSTRERAVTSVASRHFCPAFQGFRAAYRVLKMSLLFGRLAMYRMSPTHRESPSAARFNISRGYRAIRREIGDGKIVLLQVGFYAQHFVVLLEHSRALRWHDVVHIPRGLGPFFGR